MKFSKIDPSLSSKSILAIEKAFEYLSINLALRNDNYWCGTGIGGNNFQICVLNALNHELSDSVPNTILVNGDTLIWNADFLLNSSEKQIREDLDLAFPLILEKNKYLGIALTLLLEPDNGIIEAFDKNKKNFPKIRNILIQNKVAFDSSLTPIEELIACCILCAKLSNELDQGDTDNIQSVGLFLSKCAPENVLLSVRKHIWIDRIVKHNLDEDKVFWKCLDMVNNIIWKR